MSCEEEASRCHAADNNDAEQVVQSISVSVKKSCFDEHGINLGELLEKILEKQRERKHVVDVEKLANGHHLKGCFCGIKAVREELQQILIKERMKEKQKQDEIRNKEKQLENKPTTETNEAKRQNVSDKIPKTTPHFVLMDKDLYDYLVNNCGELQALCNSIKACETERGFEIEFNTEDVQKLKNDISALQNRFVVREHEVTEEINFRKFKDEVNATQKKNNAMIVFDSEQKTVKVIGSPKEADAIMQWILTLSESQQFDVKDEIVTKNAIETVNEQTYKHHDKRGTITEETKRDEKKTLIYDNRSECPDRRGTAEDDFMGDDSKTLTDDTKPQHPDQQGITKGDTKSVKKALIGDTNSEHRQENIKAETRGDDEKTLNDSNKSENPDTKGPTTDETKSYPDKDGTSKGDTMGYDKKTLLGDTNSEHQARKVTTKDEAERDDDKNTPTDNSKPEYPDKKGITKDDSKGDDDKPLNEDTTSKHQERKVTANDEARGHDKKTLNDNTKSEDQEKKGPNKGETNEDDQKTTDDRKSYPEKIGTSKDDTLGYNKKILTDDTKSEYPDKEVTITDEAKGHDKNTLIGNTKSEYQDVQDPTTDNTTGDDDRTLTDDTTSEHQDIKGASKLDTKKINAKDTMVGHDSMGGSGKESNVKLDISEKGKAADKDKDISVDITRSYPLQQPTKPRKLMYHILMDEDAYKYIQRFLHQELEDVTTLCNSVQELRDEASNFYLGYTVKYEIEHETVRRRFQMLIDQVKVEEYNVPDVINASDLESVVHASDKSEATMTFVENEKNSLKIVGRPDKVDRLKKHIEETVSEQLLSQNQLSKENTHTYYSEQPCKQQSGRKCYYHIPIDKNLYTYLSTHCQKEIEQASERCTSITASEKGSAFTIDFELQDKRDEGFVKRIFEKLFGQFKSEECRVMKGIDIALIEAANTLKEVMIFPQEDKQLLKLIGPNPQVSKTKKWIENLISNTIQSEQLSKQKPHVTNPNVHSSPIRDQSQSSKQSMPLVSTSLGKSNPVHSSRKPGERFKITSTTSEPLVYESRRVKNKLTVRVHYANITKEKSDVLVSYDDEWLQGCTFLAIAMKDASGPDIERELANISKSRGPLEEGQVVHTSAGKLRPSVKYLVHAVRAKRSQHHPEDPKTFEILYKTFLNCFKYTNDKICQKSISIPPIGLRTYGVQLVSAAFSQAVEEYDAIAEATSSLIELRSIHFVVQDPNVVKQMITSIKSILE